MSRIDPTIEEMDERMARFEAALAEISDMATKADADLAKRHNDDAFAAGWRVGLAAGLGRAVFYTRRIVARGRL